MNTVFYPSSQRGSTNVSWLNSRHSFSFGEFYNPNLTNFGALLVINDDIIDPNSGFGMHFHKDMEIITIIKEGELEHQDNAGNKGIIKPGEIQFMRAGKGIMHSEYNNSPIEQVKLFQIWIAPNQTNLETEYKQTELKNLPKDKFNPDLKLLFSPNEDDGALKIAQNAYIYQYLGQNYLIEIQFTPRDRTNLIYIFCIEGSFSIHNQTLNSRDAIGITCLDEGVLKIDSIKKESEFLVFEVPKINFI
jgi:quercetin 2,3-dioxygenase